MKVFKITIDKYHYGIYSPNQKEALELLEEEIGSFKNEIIEEIPQVDWDKKTINIYEDNNFDSKPFKSSINDEIVFKNESQIVFTNDYSIID
jgi:hypothetical protein